MAKYHISEEEGIFFVCIKGRDGIDEILEECTSKKDAENIIRDYKKEDADVSAIERMERRSEHFMDCIANGVDPFLD